MLRGASLACVTVARAAVLNSYVMVLPLHNIEIALNTLQTKLRQLIGHDRNSYALLLYVENAALKLVQGSLQQS